MVWCDDKAVVEEMRFVMRMNYDVAQRGVVKYGMVLQRNVVV